MERERKRESETDWLRGFSGSIPQELSQAVSQSPADDGVEGIPGN